MLTDVLLGRRPLFCTFIYSVENIADSQVRILAYCLMTNQLHLVVLPEREDSPSVLFGRADG